MATPINVTLILDDRQYTGKLQAAGKAADDLGNKIKKASDEGGSSFNRLIGWTDALANRMASLGTILLGVGFVEATQRALELSDNIGDLSKGTDIAILRILQLREAFAANGGNAEGLSKILQKLNNIMYEAQEGSAQAQEALLKLGFSFSEIANLNTDQALQKVIEKLAGITDPVERNALAFKTLGKEARNIDWAGIAEGTTDVDTELAKYAVSIENAAKAHDSLQQAQEKLLIAFTNILDQTGVLEFINKLNGSMEQTEKVVTIATTAFGVLAVAMSLKWVLEFAAAFIAVSKAVMATTVATQALTAANVALAATPVGRILAIVAAVAGLAVGALAIDDFSEGLNKLAGQDTKEAQKAIEDLKKKQDELNKGAGQTNQSQTSTKKPPVVAAWSKEIETINQLSEAYKRNNDELIRKVGLENSLIGVNQDRARSSQQLADFEKNYAAQIASINDKISQELLSPQSAARDAKIAQYRKEKKEITDLYEVSRKGLEDELNKSVAINEQLRLKNIANEDAYNFQVRMNKITDEYAKLGLTQVEQKIYDIQAAARDSANEQIRKEEELLGYQRNSVTGELQKIVLSQQRKDAIIAARKAEADQEEESIRRSEANARRFETGWNNAFKSYIDQATNAARQAESIFSKLTSGMEDMIVNFAKTGKLEWRGFVNSMLEELLRSQVRQIMAQLFSMPMSGQQGGNVVGNFFGSLLGFANGGVIPSNNPVIVGERGPELLMGAAGRTVVPNEKLGMSTVVNYNISAVDAMSFKQMIAQDPSFIHAVATQGARGTPGRR